MNSGGLMLLVAAAIWGFAFVAQSVGMDYVEPFTFSAIRMFLGALTLMPLILVRHRRGADLRTGQDKVDKAMLFQGSVVCGVLLAIATNLQQFGILYTTVGKAGFITALYIVFVPLLRIFGGKWPQKNIWIGVVISAVGLYLLCLSGAVGFGTGDLYLLACALFFSFQIIAVDYYGARLDGVLLSAGEFFVCGLVSLVVMLLKEHPVWEGIYAARLTILYAGILSSGAAYTLQVIGQQRVEPSRASLIMCLESPISVLAGWLILHQTLSARELCGCALMFAAILISQREPA